MIKDHRNTCDLQQTVVGGRGERHIVISYNWGHQEVVKKISESLKNENIKVWMNVDNMQGCIVDDMANAIEQADIVLVCYSSKYRNSYNCRAEARYAYQLRKTIIPLKMEKGYTADSWLSFIIGSLLYFDFGEELNLEEKVNKLIRAIQQNLSEQNKANTGAIQQDLSEQNKTNTGAIQQDLSEQNKTNTGAIQQDLSEQNETNTGAIQQDLSEQNETNTGAIQQDLSKQNKTNTGAIQQDLSEQNETNTGEIQQDLSEQNETNTGATQQDLSKQNKTNTEAIQKSVSEQNKTNAEAIQQDLSEQNQTNTGATQQDLREQNKTNTGEIHQELNEQNQTNTGAMQQDLSEQNKTNTGATQQDLREQNKTNTGEIQQELGEQNKKDTEVLQNQQPLRKNSFKPSEIPDLQTCLCYFCIRMLLLLLLIGLSCLYLSSKPASPPATPDMSGDKPKEEQTSEIYDAMNWTLLQVEEWLNDKIFQKDMLLSTRRQLKALRGKDVAFLKLLVRECPNTFYQTIREQLGMKDIQSMSDFRLALEDIGHVDNCLHYSSEQIISSKTVETTKVRITV
ncbi:M protein, serotype 5-like [Mytilus edulis]|uniref:M protein, serotype 5-like n=1 Tax=Mytilus edulis TaxID=6550 RepID=UPI0039F0C560